PSAIARARRGRPRRAPPRRGRNRPAGARGSRTRAAIRSGRAHRNPPSCRDDSDGGLRRARFCRPQATRSSLRKLQCGQKAFPLPDISRKPDRAKPMTWRRGGGGMGFAPVVAKVSYNGASPKGGVMKKLRLRLLVAAALVVPVAHVVFSADPTARDPGPR